MSKEITTVDYWFTLFKMSNSKEQMYTIYRKGLHVMDLNEQHEFMERINIYLLTLLYDIQVMVQN